MTALLPQSPPDAEKDMMTYISTDLEKLFLESFFSGQRHTTVGSIQSHVQIDAFRDVGRYGPSRLSRSHPYDLTIVRFYEDIISELQRELARYKDIVQKLLFLRDTEAEEIGYAPGEAISLPPEIEEKIRGRTAPGLALPDYEI